MFLLAQLVDEEQSWWKPIEKIGLKINFRINK